MPRHKPQCTLLMRGLGSGRLPVPRTDRPPENAGMTTILLILLILLILGAFGGGFARPAYRGPGIGIGTILLIILLILIF